MKKLVLSALCAVAMAACGGGGGGDDTVTVKADAAPGGEADAEVTLACNPATQAGCATGEKCAQLTEQEEPYLGRVACVPDGAITEGGECTFGEPGSATGFDDCVHGTACLRGVCTKICAVGPPDGCRSADEAFGEGSFCTPYENLFNDVIGLCNPACYPTHDTIVEVDVEGESKSIVKNDSCDENSGCYLTLGRGSSACGGTPLPAATATQNKACYGPKTNTCYSNGCASGFNMMLPKALGDAATTRLCVRYCTPDNVYRLTELGPDDEVVVVGEVTGIDNKCSVAALSAIGGVNSAPNNQCRFVNTFYSNVDKVPDDIGMCTPTVLGAIEYGDCATFEWEGMQAAWNDKADGAAAVAGYNAFCVTPDPTDPMKPGTLKEKCVGLFRGCISTTERITKFQEYENTELPGTPDAFISPTANAKRYGVELFEAPTSLDVSAY